MLHQTQHVFGRIYRKLQSRFVSATLLSVTGVEKMGFKVLVFWIKKQKPRKVEFLWFLISFFRKNLRSNHTVISLFLYYINFIFNLHEFRPTLLLASGLWRLILLQ